MQYVWFIWSLFLLVVWFLLYFSLQDKENKRKMLVVSLWTSLLGLTEPIFVPVYWNPPSLFDLATKTGFDIESLLFAFGIGGIVVVLYERLFRMKHANVSVKEKNHPRHHVHILALLSAPLVFVLLYFVTELNPIYSVSIALALGGISTWYCRPDLKTKMFASMILFVAIYYIYFLSLVILFPGYVETVWNLPVLSGILITGIPLEELLFAASFGFIWSSIYEHMKWKKVVT